MHHKALQVHLPAGTTSQDSRLPAYRDSSLLTSSLPSFPELDQHSFVSPSSPTSSQRQRVSDLHSDDWESILNGGGLRWSDDKAGSGLVVSLAAVSCFRHL